MQVIAMNQSVAFQWTPVQPRGEQAKHMSATYYCWTGGTIRSRQNRAEYAPIANAWPRGSRSSWSRQQLMMIMNFIRVTLPCLCCALPIRQCPLNYSARDAHAREEL